SVFSSYLIIFFSFSSRRRHTRFSRDWSSDVCSSDLPYKPLLDKALTLCAQPPGSVIVLDRGLADAPRQAGRDLDYAELRARHQEIGRASCRERGYIPWCGGSAIAYSERPQQ